MDLGTPPKIGGETFQDRSNRFPAVKDFCREKQEDGVVIKIVNSSLYSI
jgi:hypothetical protein